ncbi:AAA family ATPase [Shinella granuli]|uniref:AAA family ATPase n=1 Tax=Shinella granuli TaxID=323621 RepID=UPI0013C33FAA
MRISRLDIKNFRGINLLKMNGLGDTIIIAGQNGSGKSCIFDAIRLLKSSYGGYQYNEWQQFFWGVSNTTSWSGKKFERTI